MHPRLANAKKDFHAGRLDDAVTGAVKAVETGVRDAAGAQRSLLGLDLMKAVFMPGGLLADPRVSQAENIARAMMYQGFIGWWRNRAAHHTWPSSDPQPVGEILLTADYLLRTADASADDKAAGWPEEPPAPV
jgi:hypothetical protein